MSSQSPTTPARVFRRVLAVAVVLGASAAPAADVPSLDQIKARLKQQRDKIQSLYVETTTQMSSPLSLEEVRKLPGQGLLVGFMGRQEHFAFKGQKRYHRIKEPGAPGDSPPVPQVRPKATPAEKRAIEQYAKSEKKAKAMSEVLPRGPRTEFAAHDSTTAFNGKVLWSRRVSDVKLPDGTVKKGPPMVGTQSPRNVSRSFPPPAYLAQIGLAIPGPDIDEEDPAIRTAMRMALLPDLLELGTYQVSGTEEVDGAKCVVLRGTVKAAVPGGPRAEAFTLEDKLWLDLDRGLALRKLERKSSFAPVLGRQVNANFEEPAPGIWLPKETEMQMIAPADNPDYPEQVRGKPFLCHRTKVVKWVVNQVPDDLFDLVLKPGETVEDMRGRAPLPLER